MWHRGQLINLPLLRVISSVRKKKEKRSICHNGTSWLQLINVCLQVAWTCNVLGRSQSILISLTFIRDLQRLWLRGNWLFLSDRSFRENMSGSEQKIHSECASSPASQNAAWRSLKEGEPQDRDEEAKASCTAEKMAPFQLGLLHAGGYFINHLFCLSFRSLYPSRRSFNNSWWALCHWLRILKIFTCWG